MNTPPKGGTDRRSDRLLKEFAHDPYRSDKKLADGTQCPECNAVYLKGRWTWNAAEAAAGQTAHCPACRRINDRYPAGELELSGSFFDGHRDEIMGLIQNIEQSERQLHPLNRIMGIEAQTENVTVVTTTDIHLPHRFGHALEDAWSGDVKTHYDPEGYFTRVSWHRDD